MAGQEQMWPADRVERWSIDRLIPYARNARQHSPEQIAQIAASIKEWGWTVPVLTDEEGGLIAGHGRVLAARKLGLDEIPVMVARGWTEAQKRAYVLADNKLTENATWDTELLGLELGELQGLGFDLQLTGFGEQELTALLADKTEGLTDPDDAPPLPERPVSETGDLWLLGRHRLLCGDSTVATDVDRVLGGVQPHLMVTDPPYGVNYDATWSDGGITSHRFVNARARGGVENDDRADWRAAWALFPGDVAYVWFADKMAPVVGAALEAHKLELRAMIIWAKSRFAITRGNYHWQHEACWYAVRKGGTGHWSGDRKQTTLWQIEHLKSETGHSTQKPVECMRRPIENNSSPGQSIYEPFSGSGTTIVAAEQTGRSCLCLEISPAYVDVAVKRWQEFTGESATLDNDGRTFDEIAAARTGSVAAA